MKVAMARSPFNILVVEDHRDTLEVFGLFLESLGYRCKLASAPDLALGLARAEKFDVLITDVWLGSHDGFELVAELRRQDCLPACVFSMSAGDDYPEAARSKQAGCHRHFVKPVISEELGALLQEADQVIVNSYRPRQMVPVPAV